MNDVIFKNIFDYETVSLVRMNQKAEKVTDETQIMWDEFEKLYQRNIGCKNIFSLYTIKILLFIL